MQLVSVPRFIHFCLEESSRSELIPHIRGIIRTVLGDMGDLQDLSDLSTLSALEIPILLEHSDDDHIVPIKNGSEFVQTLCTLDLYVSWKSYETGGHELNEPEGVDDIVAFLREHMKG